jgi:hypothetical protein
MRILDGPPEIEQVIKMTAPQRSDKRIAKAALWALTAISELLFPESPMQRSGNGLVATNEA